MSKNKIMAGVLAMSMMAASTASLTANAATIPGVDTDFEYDLAVEKVSDSQLKLTFYTIVNPGVTSLSIAMTYNQSEFTPNGCFASQNINNDIIRGIGNNTTDGVLTFSFTFTPDEITAITSDYEEDFSIFLYLEAKDGYISDDEIYNFTAAVTDYESQNEGIKIKRIDKPEEIMKIQHEITKQAEADAAPLEYTYYVGDANLSETIEAADISTVTSLVSAANAAGKEATVENLNRLIEYGAISEVSGGTPISWATRFQSILVTKGEYRFACAEASDFDGDGVIEQSDADSVAEYYAEIMASLYDSDLLSDKKTVSFKIN